MNLRVRSVTGASESAIFAVVVLSCEIDDQDWVVEMVGFSYGWVIFWQAARLGGGARKFRSRDELGASPNENLCLSTDHKSSPVSCGPSFAAPSPTFAPHLAGASSRGNFINYATQLHESPFLVGCTHCFTI